MKTRWTVLGVVVTAMVSLAAAVCLFLQAQWQSYENWRHATGPEYEKTLWQAPAAPRADGPMAVAEPALPTEPAERTRPGLQTAEFCISGPYTHANLAVYLIHGREQQAGRRFLTLPEALERKKVIIRDAGGPVLTVNDLSAGEEVFIQSGDILRGGSQDRVLPHDLVVRPQDDPLPLRVFCVEHDRSGPRGTDNPEQFTASTAMLAGKELKLAARFLRAQDAVWNGVTDTQDRLGQRLGNSVRAPESASSLVLSLESRALQAGIAPYLERLSGVLEGKDDVIGYTFAVNGQLNSAEVYASRGLFRTLWPRLLRASAVEALSDLAPDVSYVPVVGLDDVRACLREVDAGEAFHQTVTGQGRLILQQTERVLLFESRDGADTQGWLHRSYYTK